MRQSSLRFSIQESKENEPSAHYGHIVVSKAFNCSGAKYPHENILFSEYSTPTGPRSKAEMLALINWRSSNTAGVSHKFANPKWWQDPSPALERRSGLVNLSYYNMSDITKLLVVPVGTLER
ncbi:hypothetical protein KC19_4G115700 [Ceratodon purpureus]|uniref:Uncharacterized protein n=1 Tax=Ceratodon purpureus TaxID=3225 RepID=A0A8T0I7Z4_CERPU|nr:hypothetical protein KC19_4G115700 [Ceratodon purpureus]